MDRDVVCDGATAGAGGSGAHDLGGAPQQTLAEAYYL